MCNINCQIQPNNARHAYASLSCPVPFAPGERSVPPTLLSQVDVATVVGGVVHQGVLRLAGGVQHVEDLADHGVHLQDCVAVVSMRAFPLEPLLNDQRGVCLSQGIVGCPRLWIFLFDEFYHFLVYQA